MRILGIILLLSSTGCAVHSGIMNIGDDTYSVYRQAATGFVMPGVVKMNVIKEARAYCTQKDLSLKVLESVDNKGPYVMGNYPASEIKFTCQ